MRISGRVADRIGVRMSILGPIILLLAAPAHLPIIWDILAFGAAVTAIIVGGSLRSHSWRHRQGENPRQL